MSTDPLAQAAHPSPGDPRPPAPAPRRTGAASAIGSWPGTDALSATRASFDQLGEPPHVPFLPELPDRGPGADLVGRAAAILVDLPVDLQPSGWRLVDHPGRDHQRARAFLRQDLDLLAEVADGYSGPLKLQVTGPFTLASALWLPRLERVVVDAGAVRDLIASLAEGITQHVGEVSRLVPGARIVLQLDEPGLAAVLTGALPTASGFGRLRAVAHPVVSDGLRAVLEAATAAGAAETAVHSCAADPPVRLLAGTGAGAVAVDVARLGARGWEQVAEAVESGTALWAGAVPTSERVLGGALPRPDAVAEAVWAPWRKLGLDAGRAAEVLLTPACGLARAASPSIARAVLQLAKEAAGRLAERSAG